MFNQTTSLDALSGATREVHEFTEFPSSPKGGTNTAAGVVGDRPYWHIDVSPEAVKRMNHAAQLYVMGAVRMGPGPFKHILQHWMEVLALVAALVSAFSILDDPTPSEELTPEHASLYTKVFYITSGLSACASLWTVILAVLVHSQIAFYHEDEVFFFCKRFAILITLPMVGMLVAVLLALVALNVRYYLVLADMTVVIVNSSVTGGLAVWLAIAYPYMDFTMRNIRTSAHQSHVAI